jgi:hypothetical protein
LVVTGDVANTGAPEEYDKAASFLLGLRDSLLQAGICPVEIIAVPGNHDLNLRNETDTRGYLLEEPDRYLGKGVDFAGFNFETIISPQDDFFRFEALVSGQPPLTNPSKLYYQRAYQVGARSILFHCFNTSWLSRRNEIQAKLYLPEQLFHSSTPHGTDLSVALFHHPYNWLNADNQRLLKRFVEAEADVVLTGHEHESGIDRRSSIRGQSLDYLQAPAFDDPTVSGNGFQVLILDFEQRSQDVVIFEWEGSRFTEACSAEWTLHRNSKRQVNPLTLNEKFSGRLQDMGTGFRHPRCVPPQCGLRLRDLYVYPDLTHIEMDKVLLRGETAVPRMYKGTASSGSLRRTLGCLFSGRRTVASPRSPRFSMRILWRGVSLRFCLPAET